MTCEASSLDETSLSQLSRREREIANLAALGLTDLEIAERLFISRRTASKHVSSVLTKLNLPNRRALSVDGHKQSLEQ